MGVGSLAGERDLQHSGGVELFMSLRGAFSSAAMSPSPAWENLGSAETPGPLPVWTMISSSAKPQGLGWPQSQHLRLTVFLRPQRALGDGGDDLAPTPRQAAQLSASKPQCGIFCLWHRLVIDPEAERRRQPPPIESCAVEGSHLSGRFPGRLTLQPSPEVRKT